MEFTGVRDKTFELDCQRVWTTTPATTTTINKSNYNKQPITVGPVFMESKQARK